MSGFVSVRVWVSGRIRVWVSVRVCIWFETGFVFGRVWVFVRVGFDLIRLWFVFGWCLFLV